jgi:hypothetical protein
MLCVKQNAAALQRRSSALDGAVLSRVSVEVNS